MQAELSKNAITVLEKRYLLKDRDGKLVETPDEMFERVARALSMPEVDNYGKTEEERLATQAEFLSVLESLEFLPNSPTLANAGARTGQLSACFVLPVGDSLPEIFDSLKAAVLIHQTGGGTGFSFSRLRPSGAQVASTMGVSSGPMPFIDVFDIATHSIKQGGMRRGANMGVLRVDHPDIMDFIRAKSDHGKLTNFNVSVAITDEFMQAVEEGRSYHTADPRDGALGPTLDAREVFREIAVRAHATGEPGLIFIDKMNEANPVPWLGDIEATNPCGEQPLLPNESCNLGSINLEKMVQFDEGSQYGVSGRNAYVDWTRLQQVVNTAIHMLDNVIDANRWPSEEIEVASLRTRKVGLGVMGWARMLALLGIEYGSPESMKLALEVMSFIDYNSKLASVELAKERGRYPAWRYPESGSFYHSLLTGRSMGSSLYFREDYYKLAILITKHGLRNACTTTVAPTGTLSIIADTTSGIEPFFMLSYLRKQADSEMAEVDNVFLDRMEGLGFEPADAVQVIQRVNASKGSVRQAFAESDSTLFGQLYKEFPVASDLSPTIHVAMQDMFQRFNDSATSKTINMGPEATVEDVEAAYVQAWKTSCKGITVYRDGSRENQPLSGQQKVEEPMPQNVRSGERPTPRERPSVLPGMTIRTETSEGKLYTVVNYDEEGMREVVVTVGRSGGVLHGFGEAIGKLLSKALQWGVPKDELANALEGIKTTPYGFGEARVLSVPDAVGKLLRGLPSLVNGSVEPVSKPRADIVTSSSSPECPECGQALEHGDGCSVCRSCGWSGCA